MPLPFQDVWRAEVVPILEGVDPVRCCRGSRWLASTNPLEWLTDNGSAYTARETRSFAFLALATWLLT